MSDAEKESSPVKEDVTKNTEEEQQSEEEEATNGHDNDVDKEEDKNEDKEGSDEEEEEDEESDDEELVGELEKPLVLEEGSKRVRKSVQRLSDVLSASHEDTKEEPKKEIPEGKGTPLGNMEYVLFKLNKYKADDLKVVYKFLFNKLTSSGLIKKNIRKFNGFDFEKDSKDYQRKHNVLLKMGIQPQLKGQFCEIFGLEKSGTKEDIVNRIMEFCMEPTDTLKPVPKPKRKKSTGSSKKKNKKKKEKGSGDAKKKKEKKSGSDAEEGETSQESEGSDADSESEGSESEQEEPPKKKQKTSPKPKPKKSPPKEKKAPKKKAASPKKKASAAAEIDSDDISSDSDDDEPLVALKKPKAPTDDQLKDLIKKILDTADLETVTMKIVCKQVYEKYPDQDLTQRKEFIKDTVKQLLA